MTSALELLPNTYRAFFSGFSALTTAQKQLIRPILNGEDAILQASTGAGKTEAVLAPATEKLITHPDHFTIIYIVPTRALALDMNRRITPIYQKLGLKSGIRTGDGKHFRDAKPHLLIMTPESLDVMLGSSNQDNKYFLKHVHIMIIDEVHVFLHDNRGHQLSYLHHRIAIQSIGLLQTIALSATIDNAEDIIRFFNLNKTSFYYKQSNDRKLQPCWVHIEDEERELALCFDDLHCRSGCKKLLVFANSRKKCEQLYDILNQEGIFSQKVFLHYSNLSTRERKFIEAAFRKEKMGVCIATSTLELGIDVGDIDGIVLMGPPPSTMAFLQRIGRGNRRQQHIKFWGICYGQNAGMQLIRFLAFFELAKEHHVEKCLHPENYSVLFQQILSCLYAKKTLSKDTLSLLFKDKSEDLSCIFHYMLTNNWLKITKQPGIYEGGWRYFSSLKKKQIWSNFPPTDEEYDVILGQEKIAILPLSMVKQLEVGDLIQLTGKALKILQIEEKKTALEVWVKESNEKVNKELVWIGLGPITPFEVAQKMRAVLLEKFTPQGLLNRTQQLLEKEREKTARSLEQPNDILVHRLRNGTYRYETFLGSVANYILYHLIERQFASKIEGLSVYFDEMGLGCNEWIPFGSLKIPHTIQQFQEWLLSHLSLLKGGFSWNSWMHCLPEEHQLKEIASRLYHPKVFEHFQKYHSEPKWLPLPSHHVDDDEKITTNYIDLKKEPWSLEKEKKAWGMLFFPNLNQQDLSRTAVSKLTATQIQGYVTQNLCPRWARFQHIGLQIESHPRFSEMDQEIQSRRQQGITFKKEVIEVLQNQMNVRFETAEWSWQQAIRTAILDKKPLFLAQAKLKIEDSITGSPDLIYIQHQESHICLEVWDIKFSHSISYAQKWRIAFYTYLLDYLLKSERFSIPVKISVLGGLVYPHREKRFEKAPFVLAPYRAWIPWLIAQWKADSEQSASIQNYFMEFSCTSCRYFSYCYQETLFTESTIPENRIVSRNIESNDFPKNSKHWYFIHYNNENIQWQCWENAVSIKTVCIRLRDFLHEKAFQKEIANQLQKDWFQSVNQGKNPHVLVYESREWHLFQKSFQSTILKSIWAMHVPWTSIQNVLQTHFIWPIKGQLTPMQVCACLGLSNHQIPPLSLYHRESFSDSSFDLCRQIWNWSLANVKSRRVVSFEDNKTHVIPLIHAYLAVHHRETECRMSDISEFQKNPLPERIKQFRAIGPIHFLGPAANKEGYQFSIDKQSVSKFRVGDFLKLSPVGSGQIQDGFSVVLDTYSPEKGLLSIRSLSQKVSFSKNLLYALDEDATDWNAPKIARVLNLMKDPKFSPEVIRLLLGHTKSFISDATGWVEQWYQTKALIAGLNHLQKQALMLPFREKIGLIEGPPGTGKTHLLVWTLIALVAHAKFLNRSIKILVTAQTHHAIDQILRKIAKTLPVANVSGVSLFKYGRFDAAPFSKLGIGQMQGSEALYDGSCLILGATEFGVYQLLEDKNFPQLFDWVVFDESSQVLAPYALLSLIFGKGQALFYGDTQQLSPILKGNYENTSFAPCSILQELIARYNAQNRLRLNETYRMNSDICQFASKQWYNDELQSVVAKKEQKLELPNYPLFKDLVDDYLDPSKSMVIVQLDHLGSQQSSQEEVKWIAKAVKRLIDDYSISSEQIGIISPHRLQNNAIISALKEAFPFSLKLPRVDTVERMQGSEFDIVIFSATVSDKATIHSLFLKDYRRFNVALTRARKKFIFLASSFFFQSFPKTEKELIAQMPFQNLALFISHNENFSVN
ncbi:MAG: DEAD/DEAH box helicase [Candidatus Rhabdochlamydia sp.]